MHNSESYSEHILNFGSERFSATLEANPTYKIGTWANNGPWITDRYDNLEKSVHDINKLT